MTAARAAGVNFIYWASGPKAPAFEADCLALAQSAEHRPSMFFAANARTNPKAVREDVNRCKFTRNPTVTCDLWVYF